MRMCNRCRQRSDTRAVKDFHVGCRGRMRVCNGCRQRAPARAVDECHVGSGGSRHARDVDGRGQRVGLTVRPLASLGLM